MARPRTSTIAICLALFFLFIIFKFPYQNLRGHIFKKIFAETKILILADEIYPSFLGWPGLGVRNVEVALPVGNSELALSSKKLIFRVGIGSLWPLRPSVSLGIKGLKKGGDLYVKYRQGSTSGIVVDAEEVGLEQIALPGFSEPITGTLDFTCSLQFDPKSLSQSSGNADLGVSKLKLPGQNLMGIIIPPLELGSLKGKLIIRGGTAEFSEFIIGTSSSDLRGTLTGHIKLGQDFLRSNLNLTLKIQLSEKVITNPDTKSLISFLDSQYSTGKSGDYALSWAGPVEKYQSRLPERVTN